MHVTIDGRADAATERWSIHGVYQFCRESVELAQMTLISGPHVMAQQGHLYGIAILAESHVSVHLDKRTLMAHLDLFSCNPFNFLKWVEGARSFFSLSAIHHETQVDRGLLLSEEGGPNAGRE